MYFDLTITPLEIYPKGKKKNLKGIYRDAWRTVIAEIMIIAVREK